MMPTAILLDGVGFDKAFGDGRHDASAAAGEEIVAALGDPFSDEPALLAVCIGAVTDDSDDFTPKAHPPRGRR